MLEKYGKDTMLSEDRRGGSHDPERFGLQQEIIMNFKTERLEIRPLSDRDRDSVIDLMTDHVVKQTYMVPDFPSREAAEPLFQRLKELSGQEERYVAGIFLGQDLIGILHETEVNGRKIEVGYAIMPRYHNQGFATEALTGAIAWLLGRGFDEVTAGAFEENPASVRVMVKSGMKKLPQSDEIEYRGKVRTCVYYSVRKENGDVEKE